LEEWVVKNFLWRYWYAGNRALLVVAAILVALLVVRRLRVFHVLVPAVIGGIVVVGWFLYNPIASTPLLNSDEGPVVKNGVAAIVVCGNKRDETLGSAIDLAPEPQTGTWSLESEGACDIYRHHPPDGTQRENRQVRAEGEVADATCGTKRDLFAALKHIPEPATGTWGTLPRGACKIQYPHPSDRWQSMRSTG
jgi:hypothetical protein